METKQPPSARCLILGMAGDALLKEGIRERAVPKVADAIGCLNEMRPPISLKEARTEDMMGLGLPGVVGEIALFQQFCLERRVEVTGTLYAQGVGIITRGQALHAIRELFSSREASTFWLFYTGHGAAGTGDWCFYDGFVTFEDVYQMWSSCGHKANRWLFLLLDACFSGQWKDRVKELPAEEQIAVQASTLKSAAAYDGAFLRQFVCFQKTGYLPVCEHETTHFCWLRTQIPTQHVIWNRHMALDAPDNDIRDSPIGLRLLNFGIWCDW
jgi:hypothetical protein